MTAKPSTTTQTRATSGASTQPRAAAATAPEAEPEAHTMPAAEAAPEARTAPTAEAEPEARTAPEAEAEAATRITATAAEAVPEASTMTETGDHTVPQAVGRTVAELTDRTATAPAPQAVPEPSDFATAQDYREIAETFDAWVPYNESSLIAIARVLPGNRIALTGNIVRELELEEGSEIVFYHTDDGHIVLNSAIRHLDEFFASDEERALDDLVAYIDD